MANLSPAPRPAIVDHVFLRDINLHLPAGPDPWHRAGKAQPCTAGVKLSYSSAIAAATADDVSLSIDYGKLYRRIESEIQNAGKNVALDVTTTTTATTNSEAAKRADILLGHDVRILADLVADCALGLLDETIAGVRRMAHVHPGSPSRRRASQASRRLSSGSYSGSNNNNSNERAGSEALDTTFGECEVSVHLPGAHLRAEGGLKYRSVSTWAYDRSSYGSAEDAVESARQTLVVDQEFRVEGIRCYCILGVNSHERVEKQCVVVTLVFRGSGEPAWGSTVVDTYQEMVKVVAEVSY
jgi:dihydroneopterin aldolase